MSSPRTTPPFQATKMPKTAMMVTYGISARDTPFMFLITPMAKESPVLK